MSKQLEEAMAIAENPGPDAHDRLDELQAAAPADEAPMFNDLHEAVFVALNA